MVYQAVPPDDEYVLTRDGYIAYADLERIAIAIESGGTMRQALQIARAENARRMHPLTPSTWRQCLCPSCYAEALKAARSRI
jgi:hypothetical protein